MSERGPVYPDREAFATRVSGAESTSVDDAAATALDRVRVTDEMLAAAVSASPEVVIPTTRQRPASVIPTTRQGPAADSPHEVETTGRAISAAAWPVLLAIAFVGGMAGALFGLWLALG